MCAIYFINIYIIKKKKLIIYTYIYIYIFFCLSSSSSLLNKPQKWNYFQYKKNKNTVRRI